MAADFNAHHRPIYVYVAVMATDAGKHILPRVVWILKTNTGVAEIASKVLAK